MHLTSENPPGVDAPFGDRFAHVARLELGGGALLLVSGQVAVDEHGRVVGPGDVVAQSERIFEIIGGILTAHGATFEDVMHVRTFMIDLDDLPGYGSVRRKIFTGRPPEHDGRGEPALPARRVARVGDHRRCPPR